MDISGFSDANSTSYAPFNVSSMDIDAGDIISEKNLKSDINLSPLEKEIKKLRNDIHDFSEKDWDDINEDIKKKGNHQTEEDKESDHSAAINSIENIRIKIKKTHREYLSIERKLVNAFNRNKLFINKVSEFNDFIQTSFTEDHHNIPELKTQLMDLIVKNNDDNNLRILISEFVDKRTDFTALLRATRVVQELQSTPCCPMCLSAPLDSFVNPCGHTGCKECLIKSIQSNNSNMNLNCPICRKAISCINPLYML